MSQWNDLENPELKKIFYKNLIQGVCFLGLLMVLIFILALSFEPHIRTLANWFINQFGVLGLGLSVFLSDLIISPIAPDIALFFIGQSSRHSQWFLWVPLLGLVSTTAGICGWFIGHRLQHIQFLKRWVHSFKREHRDSIKRFGFWMVIIGALTPLPFSLTCWLAGIFKIPLQTMALASLARIPRFVIYYWIIFYSSEIGSTLRSLFQF